MNLVNGTPFSVASVVALSENAEETLAVIIKATYDVRTGKARLMDTQDQIQVADEYRGEPGKSSVRYASDRPLHKAATDVILMGRAYADRADCRQVDVRLQVGAVTKTVRVFGDRVWVKAGSILSSTPARFERIPLEYERSFGGVDETAGESLRSNPVGVGFRGKGSRLDPIGARLPNLEDPRLPIQSPKDRPPPAGFGFIAPHWEQRSQFAGTYGPDWLSSHAPLLPPDYDPRFQQVAPPDQIARGYLRGGETVDVRNASSTGRLSFSLPAPRVEVEVQMVGEATALPLQLDTVVVDGDREVVLMTWRGGLSVHERIYDVEAVRVTAEAVE